jgi:hypothetical protein
MQMIESFIAVTPASVKTTAIGPQQLVSSEEVFNLGKQLLPV